MDSFKTSNKDESKLITILEQVVNFEKLKATGSNIQNLVTSKQWGNYFEMRHGPVFPSIVKSFWVNVVIHFNNDNVKEIWYVILNTLITITPSLIGDVIKCKEDGVDIECYRENLNFRKDILSITKSFRNPFKAFDLTPEEKLWY